MSATRVSVIQARLEAFREALEHRSQLTISISDYTIDVDALLAEVERLRAVITAKEKREAALVDMLQRLIRDADATYVDVRPYAGLGHTKIVGPFPNTLEQARAVLASTESSERSGGDGA